MREASIDLSQDKAGKAEEGNAAELFAHFPHRKPLLDIQPFEVRNKG